MMQNFGATYKETKKSFAFEGLVITSGHEFFTERGYIPGEPLPRELQKFFEDCYAFALRQIGYHGTDKNILSAVIHLDETTPHLQKYIYIRKTETTESLFVGILGTARRANLVRKFAG